MGKEDRSVESDHTVLELKKSGMRLLIPDGYVTINGGEAGNPRVDEDKEKQIFSKTVSTCNSCFIVFDTSPEEAMDFGGKQKVIDGIHKCMSDQQGLICVESGKTVRGYDYIYSIVKTLSREMLGGVMYYVRMNLGYRGKVIEIQASFEEAGYTGMREAFSKEIAHRAGLCEFSGFDGWSEDPYDPGYKRGVPMNLAERVGLDGFFPDNPLSQAREFVQAVLFDELMEESDTDNPTSPIDKKDEDRMVNNDDEEEKEFLPLLFEKGESCRRHRYKVKVSEQG